jgi:hypothetical protein
MAGTTITDCHLGGRMPSVDASAGQPDRDVGSADAARVPGVIRKVTASVAAVAAAAGLIAFAHLGAFRDGSDPFPPSVLVPRR